MKRAPAEGRNNPIRCRLYGLGVQSNWRLGALQGLPAVEHTDVAMHLAPRIPGHSRVELTWPIRYQSEYLDERGRPQVTIRQSPDGAFLHCDYAEGVRVRIASSGADIDAEWDDPLNAEDAATYLLGPVLGMVLRLRGISCLHASAVNFNGCAVAFVGDSGAGKSSTAAALAAYGLPVLTDDVLPLTESGAEIRAWPGYPRVRLWPDSARALFGDPEALPLLTPNWTKRFLDLRGTSRRFQSTPLPLGAVCILQHPDHPAPWLRRCSPREGLLHLLTNVYTSYLADAAMRRQELHWAGRIAEQVPVYLLRGPDARHWREMCAALFDTFGRERAAA